MEELIKKDCKMIGPIVEKQRPLEIGKKINKLIHYDCKQSEDLNDEVPDENEVFVKGNLLKTDGGEHDSNDELSMVNINVSVLFSEENEDISLEYSPDLKELSARAEKASREEANLCSKYCNTRINEEENEDEISEEDEKQKNNKNNEFSLNPCKILNTGKNEKNITFSNAEKEDNFKQFIVTKEKSKVSKDSKKDSLDTQVTMNKIKKDSPDKIVKNVRSLHVITKKALTTSKKHSNDVFDDKRTNFINFQTDQSKISSTQNSQKTQIINIININNNFSLENIINSSEQNNWKSPIYNNSLALQSQIHNKCKTPRFTNRGLLNFDKSNKSNTNSDDKTINMIISGIDKDSSQKKVFSQRIPSSNKPCLNKILKAYAKEKVGKNINQFIKIN